jgi:DNA-binding transcriptional ArsR family regulator
MAHSTHEPRLATVAHLVGDPSRARMLCYLLGGEYASAGELAQAAAVSAATASGHLSKLLDAGLLACEQRGRHRYYRLADADVAHALEALAMVAERGTHTRTWASPAKARLRFARCCYGHMAGRLGVAMLQGMVERQWLERTDEIGFALTEAGACALTAIGMDGVAWRHRAVAGAAGVAYACLDWSERRDHMAGRLASALLEHFLAQGWIRRSPADRALELTPVGHQSLGSWLGLGN